MIYIIRPIVKASFQNVISNGCMVVMLFGFLVLLFCQFLGELTVRYLDWPFPGPVVGMVLLLIGLIINGGVPQGVRQASEGLLTYLALLFVPAGVGLMVHYRLIAADGLVIATALVVSTAITLLVTGVLLNKLASRHIDSSDEKKKEGQHG